jgi:hypothetical protein
VPLPRQGPWRSVVDLSQQVSIKCRCLDENSLTERNEQQRSRSDFGNHSFDEMRVSTPMMLTVHSRLFADDS